MSNVICGVPEGSIFEPLLFIIYVNNLYQTSDFLKPFMFAGNTNLLYKSICQGSPFEGKYQASKNFRMVLRKQSIFNPNLGGLFRGSF